MICPNCREKLFHVTSSEVETQTVSGFKWIAECFTCPKCAVILSVSPDVGEIDSRISDIASTLDELTKAVSKLNGALKRAAKK